MIRGEDPTVLAAVSAAERVTGVVVPRYRWPVLAAELDRQQGDRLLLATSLPSLVATTPLVDLITIPETYLFRHPRQFQLLELVARRLSARGRSCQVLCAGCATGEEVWSAAAVLASVPAPSGTRHRVTGWEISPSRVERAALGRFGRWASRGGLHGFDRWFRREGSELVAEDELRSLVSFATVNLVRDPLHLHGRADVVFFRNVSLYWNDGTVGEVCAKLAETVAADGLMLVGPSDPVALPPDWKQRLCFGTRVYWREGVPCPVGCELWEDACRGDEGRASRWREPAEAPPSEDGAASVPTAELVSCAAAQPAAAAEEMPKPTAGIAVAPRVDAADDDGDDPLEEVSRLADAARYGDALELLDSCGETVRVAAKLWRGVLLLSLDRNVEAVAAFRQCVFLEPSIAEHHHWLAAAYDAVGKHALAERARRNAVSREAS